MPNEQKPTDFFIRLHPHIKGTAHMPVLRNAYFRNAADRLGLGPLWGDPQRPAMSSKTLREKTTLSDHPDTQLERISSYERLIEIIERRMNAITKFHSKAKPVGKTTQTEYGNEYGQLVRAKVFLAALKRTGKIE